MKKSLCCVDCGCCTSTTKARLAYQSFQRSDVGAEDVAMDVGDVEGAPVGVPNFSRQHSATACSTPTRAIGPHGLPHGGLSSVVGHHTKDSLGAPASGPIETGSPPMTQPAYSVDNGADSASEDGNKLTRLSVDGSDPEDFVPDETLGFGPSWTGDDGGSAALEGVGMPEHATMAWMGNMAPLVEDRRYGTVDDAAHEVPSDSAAGGLDVEDHAEQPPTLLNFMAGLFGIEGFDELPLAGNDANDATASDSDLSESDSSVQSSLDEENSPNRHPRESNAQDEEPGRRRSQLEPLPDSTSNDETRTAPSSQTVMLKDISSWAGSDMWTPATSLDTASSDYATDPSLEIHVQQNIDGIECRATDLSFILIPIRIPRVMNAFRFIPSRKRSALPLLPDYQISLPFCDTELSHVQLSVSFQYHEQPHHRIVHGTAFGEIMQNKFREVFMSRVVEASLATFPPEERSQWSIARGMTLISRQRTSYVVPPRLLSEFSRKLHELGAEEGFTEISFHFAYYGQQVGYDVSSEAGRFFVDKIFSLIEPRLCTDLSVDLGCNVFVRSPEDDVPLSALWTKQALERVFPKSSLFHVFATHAIANATKRTSHPHMRKVKCYNAALRHLFGLAKSVRPDVGSLCIRGRPENQFFGKRSQAKISAEHEKWSGACRDFTIACNTLAESSNPARIEITCGAEELSSVSAFMVVMYPGTGFWRPSSTGHSAFIAREISADSCCCSITHAGNLFAVPANQTSFSTHAQAMQSRLRQICLTSW